MTTATQTVEDILRPLAERTVRSVKVKDGGGVEERWEVVQNPDPRFAALRRQLTDAEWVSLTWDSTTGKTTEVHQKWMLDASLGAIVRAAAACRLDVIELYQWPGGAWAGSLRRYISTLPNDPIRPHGQGNTPEEALAYALVKAVGDEKAPLPTRADEGKA